MRLVTPSGSYIRLRRSKKGGLPKAQLEAVVAEQVAAGSRLQHDLRASRPCEAAHHLQNDGLIRLRHVIGRAALQRRSSTNREVAIPLPSITSGPPQAEDAERVQEPAVVPPTASVLFE